MTATKDGDEQPKKADIEIKLVNGHRLQGKMERIERRKGGGRTKGKAKRHESTEEAGASVARRLPRTICFNRWRL